MRASVRVCAGMNACVCVTSRVRSACVSELCITSRANLFLLFDGKRMKQHCCAPKSCLNTDTTSQPHEAYKNEISARSLRFQFSDQLASSLWVPFSAPGVFLCVCLSAVLPSWYHLPCPKVSRLRSMQMRRRTIVETTNKVSQSSLERRHKNRTTQTRTAHGNSHVACD